MEIKNNVIHYTDYSRLSDYADYPTYWISLDELRGIMLSTVKPNEYSGTSYGISLITEHFGTPLVELYKDRSKAYEDCEKLTVALSSKLTTKEDWRDR